MKKIVLSTAALFICAILCAQEIDTIRVYYLPWELKTRGRLDADDVRNFNDHKNYCLNIVEDSLITKFENVVKAYNFSNESKYQEIDVRMVLDLILSNQQVFTIEIGAPTVGARRVRNVKMWDSYFSDAEGLIQLIDSSIPEKLVLKRQTLKMYFDSGEYSEDEIEEYRSKGIIMIERK